MAKKLFSTALLLTILVGVVTACDAASGSCGHDSCKENGPFYCMGKNDTCPNKTYCAYDYYCDECD